VTRTPLSSSSRPDPLDELLAQAKWPEPTAESTQRLASRWDELRCRRIIRWRPVIAGAVAAVGLVALGAVLFLTRAAFDVRSEVVLVPTPPTPPVSAAPRAHAELAGRETTPADWVMISAADREAATSKRPSQTVTANQAAAARGARLAVIVAAADGDVDRNTARQFCAAAGAAELPLVLKVSRVPAVRSEALDAISRLADPAQLSELIQRDWSPSQRRQLITALVRRRSPDALQRYLELVNDLARRADALAAMQAMANPPVEQLLPLLCGPRADLRLAAAAALGQIDQPQVTRRLIQLAATEHCRREAFLALATSRDDDARRFVQQAANTERLASWAKSALAQTRFQ
jgi:hypothetical protein